MTTSFVLNDGKPSNYGLVCSSTRTAACGAGSTAATTSRTAPRSSTTPTSTPGYVVFSNYQGVPGGIAGVVADAFFGQHMTAVERPTATATSGVDVPARRCGAMPASTR
jgi:hypothetical protein